MYVCRETLRLDPVISQVVRVTTKDFNLGGYDIPAGERISLPLTYLAESEPRWADEEGKSYLQVETVCQLHNTVQLSTMFNCTVLCFLSTEAHVSLCAGCWLEHTTVQCHISTTYIFGISIVFRSISTVDAKALHAQRLQMLQTHTSPLLLCR